MTHLEINIFKFSDFFLYIVVGSIRFSLQMLFKINLIMLFGLLELLQGIEQQLKFMFNTYILISAAKIMKICILSSPHNVRHKAHKNGCHGNMWACLVFKS